MNVPLHPVHLLRREPPGGLTAVVLCRSCAWEFEVSGPSGRVIYRQLHASGWRCAPCSKDQQSTLESYEDLVQALAARFHPSARGALAVMSLPMKRGATKTVTCDCGLASRHAAGTWGAYLANSGLPVCTSCLWVSLLGVRFDYASMLAALEYNP